MSSLGFVFSIVIIGIFITGVIVSVSLSGDKNKKNYYTPTPSMTSLSNYSSLNSNVSNSDLKKRMSHSMSFNPYLNSSNTSTWSYGSYRG